MLKPGIALTPVKFGISFTLTFLNQAGALVHVYNDGSIHLNHGGTEMGQRLFTKVAQVAAEAFQVELDRVKITAPNTGKVPNTSATAASAGPDLTGLAVDYACRQLNARLPAFPAEASMEPPAPVRVRRALLAILSGSPLGRGTVRRFASTRSAGSTLPWRGAPTPVEAAGPDVFDGIDVAFLCAGGAVSRQLAPAAVEAGAVVIDNTSAFRMDPVVPLIVP